MVAFDSIHDMLHAAESPCQMPDHERSSITGAEIFTGSASLADAVKLARNGWQGGTAEIERLRAKIAKRLEGVIPVLEPRFGSTGRRIHMGRYLAGMPDPFVSLVDSGLRVAATIPKIVHLVCNVTVSGSIGADVILRRGAAMIVLIDTLERHGIRCKVDLVHCSRARDENAPVLETRVTVKREYEPVSLGVLAFMLAHPSSQRRLLFAVREHEPAAVRKTYGIGHGLGYGLPAESADQGDAYIGRVLSAADWSEDVTWMWLTKTLTDLGIHLTVS